MNRIESIFTYVSMDWFKGKSTGNHRFSHGLWGFPVKFPLNQSIDVLFSLQSSFLFTLWLFVT